MAFTFTKATKEQAKLRLAVFGPSGSGKTFSALRIATGLGGNIAFIDTERGSASKYADRFNFDVLELPNKLIGTYVEAIDAAAKAGYPVLIIDSLTHAWKQLLETIDKLAKAKYRGNTWSAWSEGTPEQNKLVDAILDYPGHIIATMRTKTEWTTEQYGNGKSKPVRVGLAPEQGKGIEYEFDLLMELSTDHIATVIKDRTGKYQDAMIDKPGEDFGAELAAWLKDGEPIKREDRKPETDVVRKAEKVLEKSGDEPEQPTTNSAYDASTWPKFQRSVLRSIPYYNHENHVSKTLTGAGEKPWENWGNETAAKCWKILAEHAVEAEKETAPFDAE